jgi:hypothetical protein
MTEPECIEQVRDLFPDLMSSTPEARAAVNEAVRAYPNSPALWLLHGQITMASENEDESEINRITLASYKRALELDRNCAATHRALAIFYDGVLEDWDKWAEHDRRYAELTGAGIV